MVKRLIAKLQIKGVLSGSPTEDIIIYQEYLFTSPEIKFYGIIDEIYAEPEINETLPEGIGANEDFTLEYDYELVTAGMTMGWNELYGAGLKFFTENNSDYWIGIGLPCHQWDMGIMYKNGSGWDEQIIFDKTSGHVIIQRINGIVHVYLDGEEIDTFTYDTEITRIKTYPDDTDSEYEFYLRNIKLSRGAN